MTIDRRHSFPKYRSHEEASCFNCGGDLDGSFPMRMGYMPGRGEFVQDCPKCGMDTYYDLEKKEA